MLEIKIDGERVRPVAQARTAASAANMHKSSIGAPDDQYNGYAPSCKGGVWIIDVGGTQQVSDRWMCYFGGGETLDLDGDGVPDTCVSGEISIDDVRFWLYGLVSPRLIVSVKTLKIDSELHAGKVFEPYFSKYLKTAPFQATFGKLFSNRIADCLDYKFRHPSDRGTEAGRRSKR